ncbi:MAG: T9SS type A sorting domain-containing protein [Bacteroidales bacterium]|nr:T9SS type A sorting domain-containing protein [Bacteroidales bacterium]
MKKVLLLAVSFTAMLAVSAQQFDMKPGIQPEVRTERNFEETLLNRTPVISSVTAPAKPVKSTTDVNIVNIIDIGNSFNAFGLYNGGRTALWADDNLDAITFTHRMTAPPGSGYVGFGYSTDGGMTWDVNNEVYNPTLGGANARYPQGLLYNPAGNTDPSNAVFSYFAATLDGSNTGGASWGGYAAGAFKMDLSADPTQQDWSSQGPYRQNVPSTMHINPVNGDIWVFESSLIDGLGNQYTDTLLITKGTYNATISDYDYAQTLMYAPAFVAGNAPSDEKIAFAPDGMTGYMSLLWDNGDDPFAAGYANYPVLYKTTDGGQTWSDPIAVVMSGPEGLTEIKYYLTDALWNELWVNPELVHRDSVLYTTAFDHDLAVDMYGNPHISVTIGIASVDTPYSIIASGGFGATFHIFSLDQGLTWMAKFVAHNKTFRGAFADISEDNRSQISTTMDGSKIFLSWIDTDFEGVTDNIMPDIWCVGFDVATHAYTDVFNVTFLSEGWLEAFMGTASYYVFTEGNDYIIPLVYQTLVGGSPDSEVTFKYITDFMINESMFIHIGNEELNPVNHSFAVSQNYPNPVSGKTNFIVELDNLVKVTVDIYNIMGQKVQAEDKGQLNPGRHLFQIDMNAFAPGLYFYTVKAGDQIVTRKMIVE